MIRAVVFDLDGVLIDSEQLWDQARRDVVTEKGGRWREDATAAMQGMSSVEWARYMRENLGLDLPTERIVDLVLARLLRGYERGLPLVPGALEAVDRLARRWPLAVASSANRVVIDRVLVGAGIQDLFRVTLSSEEVPRGKPWPDVYLEAARRLGRAAADCAAVEDSANGIRSALAAGMPVVAFPNQHFPPSVDVLARAGAVIRDLAELTVERLEALSGEPSSPEP